MSAQPTTVAQAVADLKELYKNPTVLNSTILKNNPLFGMLPKNPSASGEWIKIPVHSSASPGLGAGSFATVQANAAASVYRAFQVPFLPVYADAQVTNQAMLASRNTQGAFKDLLKAETDGSMQAITNLLSNYFFRSGTGTLGFINASGATSGAITFTNLTDSQFFYPGLALGASSLDGGGTVRAGIGYVQSVDRSAGTMVVSTTQGVGGPGVQPSGWSASDALFIQGTMNNAPMGLSGWFPNTSATRPTVANALPTFYGVDRSIDPVAYAGTWYPGQSESQMDGLIDGISEIGRNGGTPDVIVMGPVSMRALLKEMMGKREYTEVVGPTDISYKAVELETDMGPLPIISDRNCPPQTAFALDSSTISIDSYEQAPMLIELGGQGGAEGFFIYNADGVEVRIGAYCNMSVTNPQRSGVITLGL